MEAAVDLTDVLAAWQRGDKDATRELFTALGPAGRFRGGIELYNRRELDLFASLIPPECEHDMRPTRIPGMGVYKGPQEYRGFLDQWLDAFPDGVIELEELEASGDTVFGVIHQTTHGRASGLPVDFRYAAVIQYDGDGLLRRSWFDTDLERGRARYRELAG
jgi:ketosteroid isomerase-like protein